MIKSPYSLIHHALSQILHRVSLDRLFQQLRQVLDCLLEVPVSITKDPDEILFEEADRATYACRSSNICFWLPCAR